VLDCILKGLHLGRLEVAEPTDEARGWHRDETLTIEGTGLEERLGDIDFEAR